MFQPLRIVASSAALMILSLGACHLSNRKDATLRDIAQFHNRFNEYKFADIYNDASFDVKKAMSKEEFMQSMKAMREGQGLVLKSEEVATQYDSSPDDLNVRVRLLVTFEKGEAQEEFLYRIVDNRAVLMGYHFLGSSEP